MLSRIWQLSLFTGITRKVIKHIVVRVRFIVQWKKDMIQHRIKASMKMIWESAAGKAQLLRSRQNLISLWSTVSPACSPCRFANGLSLSALLEQQFSGGRGRFSLPVRVVDKSTLAITRTFTLLPSSRSPRAFWNWYSRMTWGWRDARDTKRR